MPARPSRVATLCLTSLVVAGCYASHEREALPVERPVGACEAIEAFAFEEADASFEQAFVVETGFLLGGGAPAGRATTAWFVSNDGAVSWRRQASEARWGRSGRAGAGLWVAAASRRQLELVLLDRAGDESARSSSAVEGEPDVFGVVADGDGVYVVATTGEFAPGPDVLIARFDADAVLEWTRSYGDPGRMREERVNHAFIDAADRLVVVTQRWIGGGHGPPWIFAVDREGDVAWEFLGDVEFDRGSSWVAIPREDGLVVAGSLVRTSPDGSARVFRLDAEGRLLWERGLDDGSARQQVTNDGHATVDGGVLLAGYSANTRVGTIWRLDADGALRWTETPGDVDGPTTAFTHSAPFRDGHLLAAPHQLAGSEERTWAFVRIDAAGQLVWRHDHPGIGRPHLADLRSTADGRALAIGAWSGDDARTALALLLGERCSE